MQADTGYSASALPRNAILGQRRYTVTVDDNLLAILVVGRDHDGSDPESLHGLIGTIRQAAPSRSTRADRSSRTRHARALYA